MNNREERISLRLEGVSTNKIKEDAVKILQTSIQAVDPRVVLKNVVSLAQNKLRVQDLEYDLDAYDNILVIGGGKASGLMAQTMEEILSEKISKGRVNVLQGTKENFTTKKIILQEGTHPIPNQAGKENTQRILDLVKTTGKNDLVISLISGGGSALLCLPLERISLEHMRKTVKMLMNAGASINELNAVRKHISRIKGGKLAKAAFPADVLSLIISDVVGNPLDVIASGPTVPDSTTFQHAKQVLKRYHLWEKVPCSVSTLFEDGINGEVPETPKEKEKIFDHVENLIIANNRQAIKAGKKQAEELGYQTRILSSYIEGEAREVGTVLGAISLEIYRHHCSSNKPIVLLGGGESTVTVTGHGNGGRNQELALSSALKIAGETGITLASIDTDGIDGDSPAAGALINGKTIPRARKKNIQAHKFLENNDSFTFFKKLGGFLFSGPTGTNVNDLICIILQPSHSKRLSRKNQ